MVLGLYWMEYQENACFEGVKRESETVRIVKSAMDLRKYLMVWSSIVFEGYVSAGIYIKSDRLLDPRLFKIVTTIRRYNLSQSILVYLPTISALLGSIIFLWLAHWLLLGRHENFGAHSRLPRQLLLFMLTLLALILLIILFPMADSTRGQVITLLGLLITGVIALSSTTFVANVMAGLMLQIIKTFTPGDFIRVADKMGRVTERGLFHTEIQTESRDLITIPNLHLATNTVTVVHSTGTIISAELSLGYDISRLQIEDLLKQAALRSELQAPFVLVLALNDFSVVYRISGFLEEVKNLITANSNLKKCVLDVLHENDIEIVSPSFMNQRQTSNSGKVIPKQEIAAAIKPGATDASPEDLIFDKAEVAAETDELRSEIDSLKQQIDEQAKTRKTLSPKQQQQLEINLQQMEKKKQRLTDELTSKELDPPEGK